MSKSILFIGLTAFCLSGFFVSCKKEKVDPVREEITINANASEKQIYDEYLAHLDESTEAERAKELKWLKSKLQGLLSNRDTCAEEAWDYGTAMAAGFNAMFPQFAHLNDYTEWYYTNSYYEEHCVE